MYDGFFLPDKQVLQQLQVLEGGDGREVGSVAAENDQGVQEGGLALRLGRKWRAFVAAIEGVIN